MIHWAWLLIIIPVAFFLGMLTVAMAAVSKMAWLRTELSCVLEELEQLRNKGGE